MLGKLKKRIYRYFEYMDDNKDIGNMECNLKEMYELYDWYMEFCNRNKDISYSVQCINVNSNKTVSTHKFVGAIYHEKEVIFTPNKADVISVLKADGGGYINGKLTPEDYKWTGECAYNNKVFFFPRAQSDMLVYSDNEISRIKGYAYGREHHYGGVQWRNLVIQPPRTSSHFLIWNLDSGEYSRRYILPDCLKQFCSYNCSILHPNGYIYFFPDCGRVIKMNPQNLEWKFVGDWLNTAIFDAKVAPNGIIYAFSNSPTGIVKYDVEIDMIEILYADIYFGAYGTKLGVNGKMYSVPGTGRNVWEFNPTDESVCVLQDLQDDRYAKYAGGCVTSYGDIFFAPAFAEDILQLKPSKSVSIPKELYRVFWADCY